MDNKMPYMYDPEGEQTGYTKKMRGKSLRSQDDMDVLSALYNLSSELSLANDAVVEDPNMVPLVKELIILFERCLMPDVAFQAIMCINHLLDINPLFTTNIIKYGGLPKIVNMTQNIEFIDTAEQAIKAIEKMSTENPLALLENDAFASILGLIDFFDLNLRKSAVKACVNMSISANNKDYIKKFVLPAIPSLSNMTKLSGNSEIEKNILDRGILCFYYIINNIKAYNIQTQEPDILQRVMQHGLLDNLFEVLANFLKIMNDNEVKSGINKDLNIFQDTLKNIIKIFQILCNSSVETTNLILNMNILEIIYSIIVKEMGTSSDNEGKSKLGTTNHTIFVEIFALLQALFPEKKNKKMEKLVDLQNKDFLVYFSEKILNTLISNIVSNPSTNTLLQVIKLVETYVFFSNKEQILIYVDAINLSNVASKMLDSKDTSYIFQIFDLIELVMTKCPEGFITSFIREGVIDNIKALIEIEDANLYIPTSDYIAQDLNYLKNKKMNILNLLKTGDLNELDLNQLDEDDISMLESMLGTKLPSSKYYKNDEEDDNEDEIKPSTRSTYKTSTDYYKSYYDKNTELKDIKEKPIEKPIEKKVEKPAEKFNIISSISNSISNFSNLMMNKKNKIDEVTVKPDVKTDLKPETKPDFSSQKVIKDFNKLKDNVEGDDSDTIPEEKDTIISEKKAKLPKTKKDKIKKQTGGYNDSVKVSGELKSKAKELYGKYFIDEKIDVFFKDNEKNPKLIKLELEKLAVELKLNSDVSKEFLVSLKDMLVGETKLTFFELEKSEIIYYLTTFFDENFIMNLESPINEYKEKFNPYLIDRLNLFFNVFNNDIDKLQDLIKILQYSICSMNCFKLYIYEFGSYQSATPLFIKSLKPQILNKEKMKVFYEPSDESIKLSSQDEFVSDLHSIFTAQKNETIILDEEETFAKAEEYILMRKFDSKKDISPKKRYYDTTQPKFEDMFTNTKSIELNSQNSQNLVDQEENLMNQQLDRLKEMKERAYSVSSQKSEDQIHEISNEIKNTVVKQNRIGIKFFLHINNQRYIISKSFTINDLKKELKLSFKKQELVSLLNDFKISFEFENFKGQEDKSTENKIKYIFEHNVDNINNMDQNLFLRFYQENIISNSAIYSVKRASPFFFIISLLELSINQFGGLFNFNTVIKENVLENLKVSSLIVKQVRDPYAISSNTVPLWCKELCYSYPYLSSFNSRYLLFKTCSFDITRSMYNLYSYVKNFMGEVFTDDKTITNLNKRKRCKIDRDNILNVTDNLMGFIEFEYINEIGTGNGPNLEFYSLIFGEIKKRINYWYRTDDHSLYPLPSSENEVDYEKLRIFKIMGFAIARALYDDRLIDIPLNSLFWDIVLDRPFYLNKIEKIDKNLFQAIKDFKQVLKEKERYLKANKRETIEDLGEAVKYNNTRVDEIGITFVLPGYNDILLKPAGSEVLLTIDNLEEYVNKLFDNVIGKGISQYINEFKKGFNIVFPIKNLKCFQSKELEEILCGSTSEAWDYETLLDNIVPNHGYDKYSFDGMQKKQFLLFVTGSPRLPLGGFKKLMPKLTVVKKTVDSYENADGLLPTVMTCQNYLKIPEYRDKNLLKEKLVLAMMEGSNSFHLS